MKGAMLSTFILAYICVFGFRLANPGWPLSRLGKASTAVLNTSVGVAFAEPVLHFVYMWCLMLLIDMFSMLLDLLAIPCCVGTCARLYLHFGPRAKHVGCPLLKTQPIEQHRAAVGRRTDVKQWKCQPTLRKVNTRSILQKRNPPTLLGVSDT